MWLEKNYDITVTKDGDIMWERSKENYTLIHRDSNSAAVSKIDKSN
jgi:hypothetical protein